MSRPARRLEPVSETGGTDGVSGAGGAGEPRAPRRMAPGRRRRHLVDTALRLYADQPPDVVTADDVARAADVSRALVYRYFPTLHQLRAAALERVVAEVTAAITPPPDLTPLDQVRHALHNFLGSAQTYSAAYVALLRTGSLIATEETNRLIDSVREHVVRLVTERLVPRPDADAPVPPMLELTLRSWFAVVEGASVAWLRDGTPGRDELENWLVDQLAAMLATTARHDPATAARLAAALPR